MNEVTHAAFHDELEKLGSMKGFSKAVKRLSPEQLRSMWEKMDKRVFREPLLSSRRESRWLPRAEAAGTLVHRELVKKTGRGMFGRVGEFHSTSPRKLLF